MKCFVFLVLLVSLLTTGPICNAEEFTFSGWQMSDPVGGNLVYHGGYANDTQLFSFMRESDGNWVDAPDVSSVGFYVYSDLRETPPVKAYFKYFRTYLYIPNDMASHQFAIHCVKDDVVDFVVNGIDTGWTLSDFGRDGYHDLAVLKPGFNTITARLADVCILGYFQDVWIEDITTGSRATLGAVPEPSSLLVLGGGLLGLIGVYRRHRL